MGRARADANDLQSRLRPWFEGEKAWLFNAPHDVLSFSGRRIFGFDMTHILDNQEVRTPALMYLYHRLDELLTGEPVLIFMDEGWKLLAGRDILQLHRRQDEDDPQAERDRRLRHAVGRRHCTRPQSHTLIEQSATNIHFPNPRADEESYIRRFGLTAKEYNFIRNTPPERRTFLIKHGNDSVIARLDLSAMPDMVRVLSGRKETIEAVRGAACPSR